MKTSCLARSIFFLVMLIHQSASERTCPILCNCLPDYYSYGSSFKAICGWWGMTKVPELNMNITYVSLKSDTLNLQGYDFQDAANLRTIVVNTKTTLRIHRDTFRSIHRIGSVNIISKQSIHIELGAFKLNASLSTVILKGNLAEVPSDHLCEHRNLRTLVISDNQIASLRLTKCVAGWKRFNKLDVSNNPLHSVKASDLRYLQHSPLKELKMNGCGLTVLSQDLFRYTPMLEVLDLGQNNISILPSKLFHNLQRLSELFLSDTLLRGTSLHGKDNIIPHLKRLDYSHSKFMNISFDTQFRNATQLENLNLGHTSIDLQESTLANLNAAPLSFLSLNNVKLRSVAKYALRPLRKLGCLNLVGTPVDSTILHSMLAGISDNLTKLILEKTGLSKLEPKVFSGFSHSNNLKVLYLNQNNITVIEGKTFAPLKQLEYLDLSANSLSRGSLRKNSLFGLSSLTNLLLAKNQLFAIPDQNIVGRLPSLIGLDLRSNGITLKNDHSLRDYVNLTSLNLGQNSITEIRKDMFRSLRKLRNIRLHYNRIQRIETGAFDMLQHLYYMDLYQNNFQLTVGLFEHLGQLNFLRLERNTPVGKPENLALILRGLTELETVSFSGCRISYLPSTMFYNNSNLVHLSLSFNWISSWEPSLFAPLKKLERLELVHNQITTLREDSFKFLKSLKVLTISYNPIACTCDMLWFGHWVNTVNVFLPEYLGKGYVCASPPDVKGVLINDLAMSPIDCSNKTFLHLLSGSGGSFILLCIALSLAYRYRWYIRYYRFLISARRRQARDALLEEERFQYDAYVCYHHTSRHWVINNLLPELEYKGGIKLCLHDRDWLAGPYILDNIVDSLDKSRKTLLVVTNEFVKSAWCREETTLAYHRLVEEQRNLLVVVLLENIGHDNLDNSMRTILTSRTYLTWPSKMKREKKFWKALRRAVGNSEGFNGHIALGRP